ncbi:MULTISPECIES: WecB/TagA/CpsF family glycosyltransferase [Arthrobacter]|uniref:WecB/TagA/CpsF family glycosyltransferase n=2 Tax=Arthrobacter TaxID=1663 RepID=A0ABU9KPF9_9MICC|nr:WecB/TagA/CpsF family glycosyltransferase [Arthrobacter sp. YJM1]MDP5228398.1 WecB/TagA/CpsF family glycosyltransferase [Arthrobacter sp. YJM1]
MGRVRLPFLDVDVTPFTAEEAAREIGRLVATGDAHTVVGHNLHSVTLYHSDPAFAAFYDRSTVILLDGAPLAKLWARTFNGGQGSGAHRVGSVDWLARIAEVDGLERIAVLGSGSEANTGAVAELRRRLPQARVEGRSGEGWNAAAEAEASAWLREFAPQLVLTGLGMPLQEQVITRLVDQVPAVHCAVGGAIDQVAGIQRLAPRWIGRLGFEWAWRLLFHPRRVAYRVFVEPWKLFFILQRRRRQGTATTQGPQS